MLCIGFAQPNSVWLLGKDCLMARKKSVLLNVSSAHRDPFHKLEIYPSHARGYEKGGQNSFLTGGAFL